MIIYSTQTIHQLYCNGYVTVSIKGLCLSIPVQTLVSMKCECDLQPLVTVDIAVLY